MQCKHRAQEDLKMFGERDSTGASERQEWEILKWSKPGVGVVSTWGTAMIISPRFRLKESWRQFYVLNLLGILIEQEYPANHRTVLSHFSQGNTNHKKNREEGKAHSLARGLWMWNGGGVYLNLINYHFNVTKGWKYESYNGFNLIPNWCI